MDIINDNSWNNLLQISEKLNGNLPDYVKQYTPLTKESASSLEPELFADERNRLFPVDSPANAWMSAMYFAYNKDQLPYKQAEFDYVKGRIQRAVDIYKIAEDVSKAIEQLTAETKSAADPSDAYGLEYLDGNTVRWEFPMHDKAGVVKAARFFNEYRKKYTAEDRNTIATNIMRKAAEFGVAEDQLPAAVLSEAGYGIPDKHQLMEEILYRARMAKNAENAVLLGNLNFMLADLPIEALASQMHKIAMVMADFDVAEGLDNQYGKKLMPPADTVYGTTLKSAQTVLDDAVKLNKYMFSAVKLANALAPAVLDNLLGDGFVAPLVKDDRLVPEKLAKALTALPADDRAALEEYLQNMYE